MDNQNPSADSNIAEETYDLLAPDTAEEGAEDKVVIDGSEEDVEEPKKEEKKEDLLKEEDKEEKEEEIELGEEEEEEEIKEEDVDLVTPVRTKEILAKYPKLFEDFPYLKVAYYRDRQFTELLPTIDDARQAVENTKVLGQFQDQLFNGNTENLLKVVKQNDENAFAKIVDEYLPTLQRVDPNAYFHILGNVVKSTILGMAAEGKRLNNDDLKTAAMLVHQFVFGNSEMQPIAKFSKEVPESDKAKQELQGERAQFIKEKFETVRDDLQTRTDNSIKSTIDLHIDPNGQMTDYVKRNAIRDAMSHLHEVIAQDRHFRVIIDKLWERAFQDNFSQVSLNKIRSTYLTKAKTELSGVIQKARNEALRGLNKPNTLSNGEMKDKRGPIKPGRATTSSNSGNNKNSIPKGMKTIDFLMGD